jgi:type III restriction enzyme
VDPSRPEAERAYALSLFQEADVAGYIGAGGNIVCDADGKPVSFAKKSVYGFLVTDSELEREFGRMLLDREEVKCFVKLPSSFTIPTPLGTYNPDWAVTVERPDGYRYIVFETKPHSDPALLRGEERGKIAAARLHFDAVWHDTGTDDAVYEVIEDDDEATAVIEGTA